jgi:metallo-beta-lactamase class B
MHRLIRGIAAVVACSLAMAAGCRPAPITPSSADVEISKDIAVHRLAEGVWVYTAVAEASIGIGRVPANGLLIVDGNEAMLIDLPWTDEQTARLSDWVAAALGAKVKTVVPTHFHVDCMGGLAEAHRRGAVSYGLDKTIAIARQQHLPVPQNSYPQTLSIRCGKIPVQVTYFGASHTQDNVVAWLPNQKILFAGCMVKELSAKSLGNTKDGNLAAYPATLRKVRAAYPSARIVVPGHGRWGGLELIDHTLELCTAGAK